MVTEKMIEAAKAAYWHEVHNVGGYSDQCYRAAIEAALSTDTDTVELPYHCDVCTTPGYGDAPCSPLCDRHKENWQIVPKEPTEEMFCRGDDEILNHLNSNKIIDGEGTPAQDCWRAMLAAAPAAKMEVKP